jgi:hypothetical protein
MECKRIPSGAHHGERTLSVSNPRNFPTREPLRSLADVELATAEYVDWFNTRWLHTAIGGVLPAEHEIATNAQNQPIRRLDPNTGASTKPGPVSQ